MVEEIEKLVRYLELNLSVLQLINKDLSNKKDDNIQNKNLNFGKESILEALEVDYKSLKKCYEQDNNSNKELNLYLAIVINSLKILLTKEKDNYEQVNKCREDITKLLEILKRYKEKTPYDKYIMSLNKIYEEFKKLNNEKFLSTEEIDTKLLIEYEEILDKYKTLIENQSNIKNEVNPNDLSSLYILLTSNYEKLIDNLKSIYLYILEDNKEFLFADYYIKNKQLIENGHFKSILDSQFISKGIFDVSLRNSVKSSIEKNVDNLYKIIENYKNKNDIDKKVNLDKQVINQNNQDDEIPEFINKRYDDSRQELSYFEKRAYDMEKNLSQNDNLTVKNLGILKKIRTMIEDKKNDSLTLKNQVPSSISTVNRK